MNIATIAIIAGAFALAKCAMDFFAWLERPHRTRRTL